MTQHQIVPVAPGIDTSIPTGPQISSKFTLTGPDGTRAVFNDQTDRDYVGMLTEVTGLDSAEVRENADDLVQMDGGIHGEFFFGRRPMTLSGLLLNPVSADDRNRRMTKLMRASNAMREDGVLSWVLEGDYEQFLRVRRAQPLRIEGAWQKTFQCALIAADPRVYGFDLHNHWALSTELAGQVGRTYDREYDYGYGEGQITGQVYIENRGNTESYPILTVYGPGTNPSITNFTTQKTIQLNYTLESGEFLTIDTLNRTVILNNDQSRYGAIDFLNTEWWGIVPGTNDVRQAWTEVATGASLVVQFRDAWL